MAIRPGTNDLKIFRRHQARCSRYPDSKKPFTYRPMSPKDKKADSIFEWMLWLNPSDYQRVRFIVDEVKAKIPWERSRNR
jgi:hypothetical protein